MNDLYNNPQNLAYVESLYETYLNDRGSVDDHWRTYFDSLGKSPGGITAIGPRFQPSSIFNPPAPTNGKHAANGHTAVAIPTPTGSPADIASRQARVDMLIRNFRVRGHMIAAINPLEETRKKTPPEIDFRGYGFTEADLDKPFSTDMIAGVKVRTLREIIAILFNTYCRSIGVQFMHIDDLVVRHWLQDRMEATENHSPLTREEQLRILMRLTDAVVFEEFLLKRFQGKKTFSLTGGESLIPLLDLAIEKAATQDVREVVIAMAHRGRLNVLANIMGKRPYQIFREFKEKDAEGNLGRGDVKYHLGYNSEWKPTKGEPVALSLCFNPSHLEFVNAVAMGRLRAKQDRYCKDRRDAGLCIQIHGDAAFIGEGVTQETLNMSQLNGYTVGGSLHVIVNNQVGFTTDPDDGRSSSYSSSIGKMLQVPIFLVNGEDPEAVAQVVRLAMDFRAQFKRDVIIDMYCYRRLGHNEQDEPGFTQPKLYEQIRRRKSVRDGYVEHLLRLGEVSQDDADKMAVIRRDHLERDLTLLTEDHSKPEAKSTTPSGIWKGYVGGHDTEVEDIATGLEIARLKELLQKAVAVPSGFAAHPTLVRTVVDERMKMVRGERTLDWGACETLSYASIVTQGHRVRLSGQDVERGTFSHRHAVWRDTATNARYSPLQNLDAKQAPFEAFNSPLSEVAVMGFEYGYSLDCPEGLTIWEAQFGDFANVAQVIIDQFIASGEEKWNRLSGVTLLLPHGMEGQGPEHSSARLERFLALCAQDNMQVIYPSTPAQIFHALRRQVIRPWRKPLIVMTPKSGLRVKPFGDSKTPIYFGWQSTFDDMGPGTRFQRVIPDVRKLDPAKVTKVLLCCGKIYHELEFERLQRKCDDIAIIRVEQLFPKPVKELEQALSVYKKGTPVQWVQEEQQNAGAWRSLFTYFGQDMFDKFPFSGVTRPPAASPASGALTSHEIEQAELLDEAFGAPAKRPRWKS
ncbi:MAG: 2-oxoglutarate dehydrogenase E1 component [Phycisphaerae bacterium]